MLTQGSAGAEARVMGDEVDGPVRGLQQMPGAFDTLHGEPLTWAHTDLVTEPPGEGAHADPGVRGEGVQRERLAKTLQSPCAVAAVPPAEGPGTGSRMNWA